MLSILILEKSSQYLGKVKISGGGRCNVTHSCFDPRELTGYYPRGHKELLGPFHTFQPADTFAWFAERGVQLKTEDDGRVFPMSDRSQTIIDCFLQQVRQLGIRLQLQQGIQSFEPLHNGWRLHCTGEIFECSNLLIATGSSSGIWQTLGNLGLEIKPAIPSLFTFNTRHPVIAGLQGISIPQAIVHISGSGLEESGPLLITHWGLSGPAILKLSAWGAIFLHGKNYNFEIRINCVPAMSEEEVFTELCRHRADSAKKRLFSHALFGLPIRFWQQLLKYAGIGEDLLWANAGNHRLQQLAAHLCSLSMNVTGKSTFKEEFVTCGGVHLREIDFRSMSSRKYPSLYLAGEVLDIDAVTGGFNFQAAWTTAFIAARAIASKGKEE